MEGATNCLFKLAQNLLKLQPGNMQGLAEFISYLFHIYLISSFLLEAPITSLVIMFSSSLNLVVILRRICRCSTVILESSGPMGTSMHFQTCITHSLKSSSLGALSLGSVPWLSQVQSPPNLVGTQKIVILEPLRPGVTHPCQ